MNLLRALLVLQCLSLSLPVLAEETKAGSEIATSKGSVVAPTLTPTDGSTNAPIDDRATPPGTSSPAPILAAPPATVATPSASTTPPVTSNPSDSCSTCVPAKSTGSDTSSADGKKSADKNGGVKTDAESGHPVGPASDNRAQQGCLGICKKYDELCRKDPIYDGKDCDDQWGACEDGCMTL